MRPLPTLLAAALAAAFATPAAAQAIDNAALLAELKRLSARIEALEAQNKEMEKALSSERISEKDPEIITRLKAVEFQTLSMQKQARQIETLEGISVGASLTGVVQKVGAGGTASGVGETRANYRGDLSVTLPGGEMGNSEGRIFAHLRFGQGNGVGLRSTYTSTPNSLTFEKASYGGLTPEDSFAILAQAWYQLTIPLVGEGTKANAREHLHVTAGKLDPFVFFDQNAIADDESAKFMNNVFVHNPLLDSGGDVRPDAYGFAPGAILQYVNEKQKGGEWMLSLGAFGAGPGANFSGSLSSPFVIAQAETAARINFLPGNYRAYVWRNGRGQAYDSVDRRHAGFGFSANQQVDDDLTLFGRFGKRTTGRGKFDRAVTLGAELAGNDWGRAADSLGLAWGRLRTSADFRADSPATEGYQADGTEQHVEMYYRHKLNSHVELTPDFQWIKRPGGDATAKAIKVVGLRAKIGF
jgi:hypothetical protein